MAIGSFIRMEAKIVSMFNEKITKQMIYLLLMYGGQFFLRTTHHLNLIHIPIFHEDIPNGLPSNGVYKDEKYTK